jgi:hypothetical protein
MREILTSIPIGCISGKIKKKICYLDIIRIILGIQSTHNGKIEWSKVLPEWCRLSLNLKDMLEKLLSRLFETNQDRLMKHEEFFSEIDNIVNLIPIYYFNLKRLTLTCTYFQSDHSINKLFDKIREENGDEINVDYYCLFQKYLLNFIQQQKKKESINSIFSVHYPISKTKQISIKNFYEQLPVEPSREKPLIIYTLSPLKFDQKCVPKVNIPEIQPMKNIRDVFFSVYDWSKNLTGLFFYLKNQLIEYEYIMKITQSSIITIHRFLKSKLLKLLCSIRNKLFDYRPLYELERIVNIIESQSSAKLIRPYHKSIVKSLQIDESSETNSTEQKSLSKIKPILRLSIDFYQKLIEYDKELSIMSDQNFDDQLKVIGDHQQPIFKTSDLSKQINNYSLHIRKIDEYVNNVINLNERFRQVSFSIILKFSYFFFF